MGFIGIKDRGIGRFDFKRLPHLSPGEVPWEKFRRLRGKLMYRCKWDFKKLQDKETMKQRILKRIEIDSNQCWNWTSYLMKNGYGVIGIKINRIKSSWLAHRISYLCFIGDIPEGYTLDHLCRNRGCVNPKHLEPTTLQENHKRGENPQTINSRKTHCIRGHSLENAYIEKQNGKRHCNVCRKEYMNKYFQAHKTMRFMVMGD